MCQPNVECNQSKQQQTFLCLKGYQNKRKAGKSYKCNQKRPLSYFKSWTNLKFQLRHYQWRKLIYNADQYLSLLSNDLLKAILKGSPSLLWQATDYGDETAFQQPLRYLENCEEMPLPTNSVGHPFMRWYLARAIVRSRSMLCQNRHCFQGAQRKQQRPCEMNSSIYDSATKVL